MEIKENLLDTEENPFDCDAAQYESEDDFWPLDDDDDRDYSPSCPWNAPGMCVSDFIR